VVANTLYYNPIIVLNHLESRGVTQSLFQNWFSFLTQFKRRHEIKVTILGLSAILYVPLAQWPPSLQSELKKIVAILMELCKAYMRIKNNNEVDSEDTPSSIGSFDSEDSDSEDDSDGLEIDEIKNPEVKNEMVSIKQNIKELKSRVYPDDEDVAPDMLNGAIFSRIVELYHNDDSDQDDKEIEDDYEFTTLIDRIDEVVFFLEAFRSISQRDNVIYQQLLSTFSPEEQLKLQELANEANQRQLQNQNKST